MGAVLLEVASLAGVVTMVSFCMDAPTTQQAHVHLVPDVLQAKPELDAIISRLGCARTVQQESISLFLAPKLARNVPVALCHNTTKYHVEGQKEVHVHFARQANTWKRHRKPV